MAKKAKDKAESKENGTLGPLARVISEIPSDSAEHQTEVSEGAGGTSEPESQSEQTISQTDPTASDSNTESGETSGL